MTFIDVVAGIIFDESRHSVLLARRKPEQHQGGLWEFPGGKQEAGESQQEALQRELFEEIAIRPDTMRFRRSIEHRYDDKAVRCLLYTSPSPRDQRGARMPSSA